MKEKFFNYGKSFVITENNKENTPRFLIEAKCVLDNIDYYLCAPCKGENTFDKENLFESNNPFEFTPIISKDETLIFRNFRYFLGEEMGEHKRAYRGNEVWGDKKFFIKEVEASKLLDTSEKIISATKEGLPIMCRIVLERRAIIDFPIKTININETQWQVDTGLIPIPSFSIKTPYRVFAFDLGYVAFNSFKFVEFLIRGFEKINSVQSIISSKKLVSINNPDIKLYSL